MTSSAAEMPLFTKTYDFLTWLVPLTNHFPKVHRHTITRRLLEANSVRGQARLHCLEEADAALSRVRTYLRMAHQWRWINDGQYEHAGRKVAELGRLLGGWQKTTRQQAAGQAAHAGIG